MIELSTNFGIHNASRVICEVYLFLVETQHLFRIDFVLSLFELNHAVLY